MLYCIVGLSWIFDFLMTAMMCVVVGRSAYYALWVFVPGFGLIALWAIGADLIAGGAGAGRVGKGLQAAQTGPLAEPPLL